MIKIDIKSYNHFDKFDWHINLIPYLNFGNIEYGKGLFCINIGWLIWNTNISVWK